MKDNSTMPKSMHKMDLTKLLGMSVLHFFAMYVLMYSMVNSLDNVLPNLNQVYMAGLMTSPMIILEVIVMRSMYTKDAINKGLVIGLVIFILFFIGIRSQTAINDREFLRSMIPHHSGAILMCQNAQITDSAIRNLCQDIINTQQLEINFMKEQLIRLENN